MDRLEKFTKEYDDVNKLTIHPFITYRLVINRDVARIFLRGGGGGGGKGWFKKKKKKRAISR